MTYFVGQEEYFKGIGKIPFEGSSSTHPLTFKFYDENKVVGGKTMKEHLKFSVAYWHSFCGEGRDPFGSPTLVHTWGKESDPLGQAASRADAAFEFITKLGAPYYCFHDADVASSGRSVAEYEKNLQLATGLLCERQRATGVQLLWNTANLTTHPRYANGAATNPDFRVLAQAAVQVKACLESNIILEGKGYTFWGGREGYLSLLNTDMKREKEHLGRFLTLARDYGRKIGFTGPFYIEPKPMEPAKHQYDYDAATTIHFLKEYGLDRDFLLNIEANHATLAGHSFAHDLQVCADQHLLGSIDANRGDPQCGWDTDQFATNVYENVEALMVVLRMGGFRSGGLNFDAKIRRNAIDREDLFLAHIGGMDAFAVALEVAWELQPLLETIKSDRYRSFDRGVGARYEKGEIDLEELRALAAAEGEPLPQSGKQEKIENLINQVLFSMRR